MDNFQTTINKSIKLNGVGLHTGKNVTITFSPAPPDVGYCFVRDDLEGKPTVEADVQWVYDCLLYTSPSPRDMRRSRMPSSA